jgi:uroporphyrinogen decarboxylase
MSLSRERFVAACEHRTPDRPPIDYLYHPTFDRALREHLALDTEEDVLDALGVDFFYLPGRDISQNEGFLPYYKGPALDMTEAERICPLGIRWTRGAGDAKFAVDEALRGPLANAASPGDVLAHSWPTRADFDFAPLREIAASHADRVLVGGLWTGIFGDSYRIFGFQDFLTAMALHPDVIHALVDRMTEMYLDLNDAYFSALNGALDVWFFGNDFGSQDGLLFSVAMWEDFFAENLQHIVELAHSYGLKVMMHSCGCIRPLLPALADLGVEIIDPVQVTAAGMQPAALKAEMGDRIVFHGGIDTQQVLPFSMPEEVAEHTRRLVATLGKDGGYITASSQLLQPDIPPENVVAMYEAAKAP